MVDKQRTGLSPEEELLLHNLLTRKYWSHKKLEKEHILQSGVSQTYPDQKIPGEWRMLQGIELEPWQQEVVESYINTLYEKEGPGFTQGTLKLPTGSGKTIIALAIIERLYRHDPLLRVAIVVPTTVLMRQWIDEIVRLSNLPTKMIGLLGDGHKDNFSGEKRILISVINSAREKLPGLVDEQIGKHLLLLVDECHRSAGDVNRKIFNVKRVYNLGLSATPEPDILIEDEDLSDIPRPNYDVSILGQQLGPIIYEMTLNEAYARGILPEFEIRHYALPLNPTEQAEYEKLSRSINDLLSDLQGDRRGGFFMSRIQRMAKLEGNRGDAAREFIYKTTARKQLLYKAEARKDAVTKILSEEFARKPEAKAILFHESIFEAMEIYDVLLRQGFRVVAENSELPTELRSSSMEMFRSDVAQIMVSVKSLIEGLNVPKADIGIIVASSTSIRSRVQSIGRVLRRAREEDVEKKAVVYTLYIEKTADEEIYAKADWDKLIGMDKNKYFCWDLENQPVQVEGPPRKMLPKDNEIDEKTLTPGCEYPGQYEGYDYSCDSAGNIYDHKGHTMGNLQGIAAKIKKVKESYGRFKVTPLKNYVLVLKKNEEEWITLYVATLQEPFSMNNDQTITHFDPTAAYPGDIFPQNLTSADDMAFKYGRNSGKTVIMKKTKGGNILFAKTEENSKNKIKGKDAQSLLDAFSAIEKSSGARHQTHFKISKGGYAYYNVDGSAYYLAALKEGLEFSDDD